MIVTREHLRGVRGFSARPGFCNRGARAWFAKHGLDWAAFLRHGIDAEQLRATGDALALAVIAHAEAEGAHGR